MRPALKHIRIGLACVCLIAAGFVAGVMTTTATNILDIGSLEAYDLGSSTQLWHMPGPIDKIYTTYGVSKCYTIERYSPKEIARRSAVKEDTR